MANTSTRMLRLLSLLQTHRYWPGAELADRLQVSQRTLRRDIDRLRELGYPVQAQRGVTGGYQLAAGAALVGVSRDTVADQKKFAVKYDVNFPLLADTSSAICDAFGVIVEKNMYGKKSIGIQRSTFLVGPDGTIAKVWPRVSVEGHAAAVLEAVRSL